MFNINNKQTLSVFIIAYLLNTASQRVIKKQNKLEFQTKHTILSELIYLINLGLLKDSQKELLKQTQSNETKEGQKATPELQDLMFSKHIQITLRVVGITLSSILIFSGGGYLLDMQIGTKPLFLILGLIVSFPLSQYVIYRTFRTVTTNIQNKYK